MAGRTWILVGAAGAVLLLAGCGSSVAGDAEPVGKAVGEPVFSPCDDIPDEAVRAAGLDPATESRDILDVHQPGWNICGWNNDDVSLSVFASIYTLDDLRNNDDYTDFTETVIDGRGVLAFKSVDIPVAERSYLATASGDGMVMIGVSGRASAVVEIPPVEAAPQLMQVLLPYLPT